MKIKSVIILMQHVVAIILLFILIIIYSGVDFKKNSIPKTIARIKQHSMDRLKLWIYNPVKELNETRDEVVLNNIPEIHPTVLVERFKQYESLYEIIMFNQSDIINIIPNEYQRMSTIKDPYYYQILLKYSILYAHGGVWIPNQYMGRIEFDINKYNRGELVKLAPTMLNYNRNDTQNQALATLPGTQIVNTRLEKLFNDRNAFNNNLIFSELY